MEHGIHVLVRVEPAQGHANAGPRDFRLQSDGQEHMRRLIGILAAGRTGGHIDLHSGQGEENRLGLEAGEGEVQGALDAFFKMPVELDLGDSLLDSRLEPVGEFFDTVLIRLPAIGEDAHGLSEPDDTRRILGPGP